MSAVERVVLAAKTIRAAWERDVTTDPQTDAAQALEDAGLLMSPEKATELWDLRTRLAGMANPPRELFLGLYDGAEPELFTTAEAAREYCDDLAPSDAHGKCWDWTVSERGVHVQVWTHPDDDRPLSETSGSVTPLVVQGDDDLSELESLRARVAELDSTVAAMHAAAVGEVKAPLLGLVEDVALTRSAFLAQQARAETLDRLCREQRARADAAEARVAELESLVEAGTEYRVWVPGGMGLYVRRSVAATGFAVWEARSRREGRRVWTRSGWRLLALVSNEELFCWPDAASGVAEARRLVGEAASVEASADALTRLFAPTQALREDEPAGVPCSKCGDPVHWVKSTNSDGGFWRHGFVAGRVLDHFGEVAGAEGRHVFEKEHPGESDAKRRLARCKHCGGDRQAPMHAEGGGRDV